VLADLDVGEEKIIISIIIITCLLMLVYTQICPASNLHIAHCLLLLETKIKIKNEVKSNIDI